MKKSMIILAALVAVSFASCKKDRTCTCTTVSTEPSYTSKPGVIVYLKSKKHDARQNCMSEKYDYTTGSATGLLATYTMTRTCTLK